MRESIVDILRGAVRDAALRTGHVQEGSLPPVVIEEPRAAGHGDFSTNIAMLVASQSGLKAREVAEAIASRLDRTSAKLDRVEVEGPGFVNMFISKAHLQENARQILQDGDAYGTLNFGKGSLVQVEFVSANPTGPLNVVSARAAAVGDSLIRLLKACGFEARSEFLTNDHGTQVELLGRSLQARVEELRSGRPAEIPEEGYRGEYLVDLAREISSETALQMLAEAGKAGGSKFAKFAVERMIEGQRKDLTDFGVSFDNWFRESSLHSSGYVEETLATLRDSGFLYEKDGAEWFKSSELGDEQDRVVRKSPAGQEGAAGEPTYFLSDVAYHRNKFERGFERVIDIWGPDHHGHVPRMQAAARALGYPPDWLEILIVQWVRLMRGKEPVSMSKRAGEFVTLSELIKEVGVDCARFFFLMRKVNSHLDFDLELAKRQSDENPVYYVQYGHARVSSVIEFAREGGVEMCGLEEADLSLLSQPEELSLLRHLICYPEQVRAACLGREPQKITSYLTGLATAFHQFYHNHRVVGAEPNLMQSRLLLVRAVKTVIKNGLDLLGVSAPDKM
ncbi:MAG: arginine--tRNA ligase [Candidatus Eiseniibacteriota bacterium]|nr:MAG: arginine--tRNA ligase [Candidatus Eisenbacteria bacterium]